LYSIFENKQCKERKEVQAMKRAPIILGVVLILGLLYATAVMPAQVEGTISEELDLKSPPVDMCVSADGKWLYVLSAGEVAVYSFAEGEIVNRIAVDKAFDRMLYIKEKNSLVVSSSSDNTVQIIQLEEVYQFDTSGLPYQGSKRAPITLVVFSDYQ
jgi:protein-disulfide isomerase